MRAYINGTIAVESRPIQNAMKFVLIPKSP